MLHSAPPPLWSPGSGYRNPPLSLSRRRLASTPSRSRSQAPSSLLYQYVDTSQRQAPPPASSPAIPPSAPSDSLTTPSEPASWSLASSESKPRSEQSYSTVTPGSPGPVSSSFASSELNPRSGQSYSTLTPLSPYPVSSSCASSELKPRSEQSCSTVTPGCPGPVSSSFASSESNPHSEQSYSTLTPLSPYPGSSSFASPKSNPRSVHSHSTVTPGSRNPVSSCFASSQAIPRSAENRSTDTPGSLSPVLSSFASPNIIPGSGLSHSTLTRRSHDRAFSSVSCQDGPLLSGIQNKITQASSPTSDGGNTCVSPSRFQGIYRNSSGTVSPAPDQDNNSTALTPQLKALLVSIPTQIPRSQPEDWNTHAPRPLTIPLRTAADLKATVESARSESDGYNSGSEGSLTSKYAEVTNALRSMSMQGSNNREISKLQFQCKRTKGGISSLNTHQQSPAQASDIVDELRQEVRGYQQRLQALGSDQKRKDIELHNLVRRVQVLDKATSRASDLADAITCHWDESIMGNHNIHVQAWNMQIKEIKEKFVSRARAIHTLTTDFAAHEAAISRLGKKIIQQQAEIGSLRGDMTTISEQNHNFDMRLTRHSQAFNEVAQYSRTLEWRVGHDIQLLAVGCSTLEGQTANNSHRVQQLYEGCNHALIAGNQAIQQLAQEQYAQNKASDNHELRLAMLESRIERKRRHGGADGAESGAPPAKVARDCHSCRLLRSASKPHRLEGKRRRGSHIKAVSVKFPRDITRERDTHHLRTSNSSPKVGSLQMPSNGFETEDHDVEGLSRLDCHRTRRDGRDNGPISAVSPRKTPSERNPRHLQTLNSSPKVDSLQVPSTGFETEDHDSKGLSGIACNGTRRDGRDNSPTSALPRRRIPDERNPRRLQTPTLSPRVDHSRMRPHGHFESDDVQEEPHRSKRKKTWSNSSANSATSSIATSRKTSRGRSRTSHRRSSTTSSQSYDRRRRTGNLHVKDDDQVGLPEQEIITSPLLERRPSPTLSQLEDLFYHPNPASDLFATDANTYELTGVDLSDRRDFSDVDTGANEFGGGSLESKSSSPSPTMPRQRARARSPFRYISNPDIVFCAEPDCDGMDDSKVQSRGPWYCTDHGLRGGTVRRYPCRDTFRR